MIAVADSGPLISLAKLDYLHLLPVLYERVVMPRAVHDEVVTIGLRRGYPDARIADVFLRRMKWRPEPAVDALPELGNDVRLGRGEREALTLAKTHSALVLMDEDYGRTIADQLGLAHVGTLGILIASFRRGLLFADALDDLLVSIESRDDIWIHPELCGRVRREVLGR